MYKIKDSDIEGINYINIDIDTENKIGKKLAIESTFNAVNTLIGKITSLRTAMEYIVTPNYPSKLLTKGKLNAKEIIGIPNNKVWVTNYWAIVTHITFERICQDKTLFDEILKLNKDIKFTSFKKSENKVFGLTSKVINFNKELDKYIFIVCDIINIILNTNGENEEYFNNLNKAIKKLILDKKADKDVSLFHNVPFDIEFDDEQLNK